MIVVSRRTKLSLLFAVLAVPVSGSLSAQQHGPSEGDSINVIGLRDMAEGPKIDGIISARNDDKLRVTSENGTSTVVLLSEQTEIRRGGGFLGGKGGNYTADSLLNGLPVTVETVHWGDSLVASRIKFRSKDFKTAKMIRDATAERLAEHDVAIGKNAEAAARNAAMAEALRGRMADIDKYNIKGTTNVYFATGKWNLTPRAEYDLCAAASEAEAMDNAMLLVVGYTDSVGSQEYNQILSEKRAGRVVNHLQQACGWKPWRMLTPTGMAEADPLASNDTAEGKAQNRRVAVNILVSKGLDGM